MDRDFPLNPDPITQFAAWLAEAERVVPRNAEAMALATATRDGIPSVRLVLLKGWDERGAVFFTDYESRKSNDLAANPRAALAVYWEPLERQVRIEGEIARVGVEESEAYFRTRPRGSQLGAWASRQSRPVPDRPALTHAVEQAEARFIGQDVPLPSTWGGYRLRPRLIEFWQGRRDRLHDRLQYTRMDGGWHVERLQP